MQEKMRTRSKKFALAILRFARGLRQDDESRVIGRQLLRSATSMAANYRAAGRGRSRAEFLAKLGLVVEEADETVFWLELVEEAQIVAPELLSDLHKEAEELLSIFSASLRTARRS